LSYRLTDSLISSSGESQAEFTLVEIVLLIISVRYDFNFFSEVLRDCSLDRVEVEKDDIIILSSDGLWDVIQSDELQEIVQRNTNKVIYLSIQFSTYENSLFIFLAFTRLS